MNVIQAAKQLATSDKKPSDKEASRFKTIEACLNSTSDDWNTPKTVIDLVMAVWRLTPKVG